MVVKEDDIYEQIQKLFAAYAFKSAQATLELNQTFGQRSSEYPQVGAYETNSSGPLR